MFADSGVRLNELLSIKADDINIDSMTVTVWGKGGKQRKAPFTKRTADLISRVLRVNKVNRVSKNIWGLEYRCYTRTCAGILLPPVSVLNNLILGAYNVRARSKETENPRRVLWLFPRLKKLAGRNADTLSGGVSFRHEAPDRERLLKSNFREINLELAGG